MKDLTCRVLVVGGGPGGYVCAIRAGQLGLDTVLVERAELGGTCLNVGCIPSKALIHTAEQFHAATDTASETGLSIGKATVDMGRNVAWRRSIVDRLNRGVAGLLKKAKVRVITGEARFLDGKTVEVTDGSSSYRINADDVVIATGSEPVSLTDVPFGGPVLSSTEALSLTDVPDRLVVVGGGYIGLELGTAFAKLGAKVTVVEAGDRLLPQYDSALTKPVADRLKSLSVTVHIGTTVVSVSKTGGAVTLQLRTPDGTERTLEAEKTLVTIGRRPNAGSAGLSDLGLDMAGPAIAIDDRCRTSMRGVYAIGDVTGEPMLAHRAMAQGAMVADLLAGKKRKWDVRAIPAICFTDPEIVQVGQTAEEAKRQGIEVKVSEFPLAANGRAMTRDRTDGFVRVVAEKATGVLLGIQAVGTEISELSAAFSIALEMGARAEDIAATIHAHPTQGEGFQEAALGVMGHALHI
ncbi:MAG: dihydrolipoyl dehydrogenase [Alphaproteobacteria bacterium]